MMKVKTLLIKAKAIKEANFNQVQANFRINKMLAEINYLLQATPSLKNLRIHKIYN